MRYLIRLSYVGSSFHGWQIQAKDESVQSTLERALSLLLGTKPTLTGAGRTDTGVNAIDYIAHFDSENPHDAGAMVCKLNAILPPQIVVTELRPMHAEFHARFDARRRKYTYFLHRVKDPFVDIFSYQYSYPKVNFEKMNQAATQLLGKHDFRCFEKSGGNSKTSICTVFEAFWTPYTPNICAWKSLLENGEPLYWRFDIAADRFLRNMVRAIVGTLLEVGRGKRNPEAFSFLILPPEYESEASSGSERKPSRSEAGESVPAKALFLSEVEY